MAQFNDEIFTDDEEVRATAARECGMYLQSCLTKEELEKVRQDWEAIGGFKTIPWWKFCFENIKVSYEGPVKSVAPISIT